MSAASAIGAVLALSVGFSAAVGRIAGWTSDETVSAAAGLVIVVFILAIGLYTLPGLCKVLVQYFRPGSARGAVVVKPSGVVDSILIRKQWNWAVKLDPVILAFGTWIASIGVAKDWADNYVFALWGSVTLLSLVAAAFPRVWMVYQYWHRKSIIRADSESLPDGSSLDDIILPRSIITPIAAALLAASISKLLPEPLSSAPFGAIAGLMLGFAMGVPLLMEKDEI
ncbi:hypothetical protein [Gordonia malaquae]|uniref:hypothetical protein n=1 Tax=Gordonia malaquae TaxID=410332 RepID=UPI0030FE7EC0